MNNTRFAVGTKHQMAKGLLEVVGYETIDGVVMMKYTLNGNMGEIFTNKYVNVISIISKYQKRHGINQQAQTVQPQRQNAVAAFKRLIMRRELKFGIELELVVPSVLALQRKLEEAGVRVSDPHSTHQVVAGWKLVGDASIRTYGNGQGVELVSPPSTGFEELEKVCAVLKEVGATVNNSTGCHVHHEIKDLKRRQIQRIYAFYNKYTAVINKFFNSSRQDNQYCQPVSKIINKVMGCETKEELMVKVAGRNASGYYNNCRYYTLNLRSYLHYGTIEFRHGHGMVDIEEIKSWVLFTHMIIERGLELEHDVEPTTTRAINELTEEMLDELHIERTQLGQYYRVKVAMA